MDNSRDELRLHQDSEQIQHPKEIDINEKGKKGGDKEHTFTRTVLPNATSNLHSDPLDRLICVGGGGTYCASTDGSLSPRPGRDIAFLVHWATAGISRTRDLQGR